MCIMMSPVELLCGLTSRINPMVMRSGSTLTTGLVEPSGRYSYST